MPTETFQYTGNVQTFDLSNVLPVVTVRVYGAGGQDGEDTSNSGGAGGAGGYAEADVDTSGFASLDVYVGGGNGAMWGRSNGGAGATGEDGFGGDGGNGGGSSEVLGADSTFLIAGDAGGGGGGAATDSYSGSGGGGGARGGSGGSGNLNGGSAGNDAEGSGNGGDGGDGNAIGDGGDATDGGGEINSTFVTDGGVETVTAGGGNTGNAVIEIDYTELAAPTNLTASENLSADEVDLSWDAVGNADGYRLYISDQSPAADTGSLLADTAQTSYTETNVPDGDQRYYQVVAYADSAESEPSNEVSLLTDLPPAENLTVDSVDGRYATLSWTDPSNNANGYRLLLKRPEDSSHSQDGTDIAPVAEGGTASTTTTELLDGQEYTATVETYTDDTSVREDQ